MTAPARQLRRRIPVWWVFTRGTWFVFFLREVTCLFVAAFALVYLCFARSVMEGPEAYAEFLAWLRRPGVLAFHCLAFVAVMWHTITWFVAAPKAIRPQVGGRPVAPAAIIAGHYAGWLAVSAAALWVLLG